MERRLAVNESSNDTSGSIPLLPTMEIKYAPSFFKSMDREFGMNPYHVVRRALRDARWEVVYAWQRVTKGYDNVDVFGLHSRHTERMIKLLTEVKKDKHGVPGSMLGPACGKSDDCECLEEGSKKWEATIDKMIEGFKAAEALDNMDYMEGAKTPEEWEPKRRALEKKFNQGMMLFTEHYFSLWT